MVYEDETKGGAGVILDDVEYVLYIEKGSLPELHRGLGSTLCL
jgi:hypothetical protein